MTEHADAQIGGGDYLPGHRAPGWAVDGGRRILCRFDPTGSAVTWAMQPADVSQGRLLLLYGRSLCFLFIDAGRLGPSCVLLAQVTDFYADDTFVRTPPAWTLGAAMPVRAVIRARVARRPDNRHSGPQLQCSCGQAVPGDVRGMEKFSRRAEERPMVLAPRVWEASTNRRAGAPALDGPPAPGTAISGRPGNPSRSGRTGRAAPP